jgi:hypothetical protein
MQYQEVLKVKERHKSELLEQSFLTETVEAQEVQKPNVVGVGIGRPIRHGKEKKDELGIIISVIKKLPRSRKYLADEEIIPADIEGIKTDVVEVGEIFAPPLEIESIEPQFYRKSRMRPACPGCSLGHFKVTAGTFGAVVHKNNEEYILSNNHVLANSNQAERGDNILQPGRWDGGTNNDKIGELTEFIPISTIGNLVDCAIAKPIYDISDEIIEIGRVQGKREARLGLKVKKSGRTTGLTSGRVIQLNATVKVKYGFGLATFEDQIIASRMSKGGDSGSLVLTEDNEAVGLLFAGSEGLFGITIMNPVEAIERELEVEI